MGKCKEALESAKGDINEAIDILRRTGMASAVKKEARDTNEGVILSYEDAHHLVIVEFKVETDFVVQNERFKTFAHNTAKDALKHHTKTVEELLAVKCSHHDSITVDEYRAEQIQSLGENIRVSRVAFITKENNHSYGVYSHMHGKIFTMVELKGASDQQELAKAIGMHIAAESPEYVRPEEIPHDVIAKEDDIARSQVEGKPAQIQDKIVLGKLSAFYDQVCLTRQKYVRDSSMTVEQVVEEAGKKMGKTLSIVRFFRWQIGA
jgi:elongation factor Ts